jgi:UMF1 family MFS transporter
MQTAPKKVIRAWTMYDWANSAYSLIITTTIFPTYFTAIAPDKVQFIGRTYERSALASYAVAFSFLIIAILSPILSSIADYKGNKKKFMQFFCYLGSAGCIGLTFLTENTIPLGIICSIIGSIGFAGSIVFYNAYLPEIAAEEDQDKVSAKGFVMGYIGSVLLMVVSLAFIMLNDELQLGWGTWPVRITFLGVGLWWAGFAQITFRNLPPSRPSTQHPEHNILVNGFYELRKVWRQFQHTPSTKQFLRSFFFYNMGVQTVMYLATYFAADEIGMEGAALIFTLVIIQLVAIAGAFVFSRISQHSNNIFALGIIILIWIGVCIGAYFVHSPMQFYILAGIVGMVMGGVQSLSRSTYSKLLPPTKDTASFFSFYDVCERVGTFLGTLSFGFVSEFFGGMRNSVLILMAYFIIGGILLLFIDMKRKTVLAT